MKKIQIALLLIGMSTILLSSCKKEDTLNDDLRDEYEVFCKNNLPGKIEYKVDGEKWETDCTLGLSVLIDSVNNTNAIFIYGYKLDGTIFNDDIEVIAAIIPLTFNGISTYGVDEGIFGFLIEGLDNVQSAVLQPEDYYFSLETESDFIKVDSFDGDNIKGTLNLSLIREEDGDNIQLTGSFDVTLQE